MFDHPENLKIYLLDEIIFQYKLLIAGLLGWIIKLREKRNNPLKLIIMSATLRIKDFTENRRLFKIPPPVVNVESRQFPVTIHFNRRTEEDYMKEAFRKTVKIHLNLPEGGILVFVTGQQEVYQLVNKLKKKFPFKQSKKKVEMKRNEKDEGDKRKKVRKWEHLRTLIFKNYKHILLPTLT